MVRRALVPGTAAAMVAACTGFLAGGSESAASAGIGAVIVIANFVAHGLSLAWASGISIPAVQAVALGGFVLRLGAVVVVMFALNTLQWFSPLAFGLAVVPATLLLLTYEARLMLRGRGAAAALQIPAEEAAVRAAERLAVREAR